MIITEEKNKDQTMKLKIDQIMYYDSINNPTNRSNHETQN